MRLSVKAAMCVLLVCQQVPAIAETPADIFHEMDARKRAAIAEIDEYSVMKTMAGVCTLEHFVKESTTATDGRGRVEYMRALLPNEVGARRSPDSPMVRASAEDLDYAAGKVKHAGDDADREIERGLMSAGLPPGLGSMLTTPPSNEPWLSPMPGDMMGNYAMMLNKAATSKRKDAERAAEANEEAKRDPFAEIASRTRIVGHGTVNSRPAVELLAENLDYRQETNDQEFTLHTLHLWVDTEHYVPLKMQMDGVAVDGGESRDIRIEREDMAYRKVPGCKAMYEPARSVMRIAGMLKPEEQAQMAEAQAKLAEFKTQMASMPQSQQDMIMRQMGPQMEMLENMASGNGLEIVSLVTGMRCNAGLPTNEEYMQTVPGISQGACIGFGGSQGAVPQSSIPASPVPQATPAGAPDTGPASLAGNPSGNQEQMGGAEIQAPQQACLQKKIAKAQKAEKKKRGFGSLMSAVSRTAGRLGNSDVSQTMGDVYSANATADDLASAARDLGLSEDDVAACQNPG